MIVDLTTSSIYGGLLGDAESAALLSEPAEIAAMIAVERALARAEGAVGVIPEAAAAAIDAGLAGITLDPAALRAGTAAAGVVASALVAALRAQLPGEARQWLHWGATSQDIVDTAMVLQLGRCLDLLERRLGSLIDTLAAESAAHADLVMAARTRGQVATPITFGLKIAQWAQPLIAAEAALGALRQEVLRVQFGGASGANTAIAPHGAAVSAALARELGLGDAPPWHGNRTPVLRVAAWLQTVTAGLGKIGGDLVLLGRSEIGEVRAGTGGGSSTMPQKANPVGAEALVTLARLAAAYHAGLLSASSPAEERDGAAWAVEWVMLPQLISACAAALGHAEALMGSLRPDLEAMARTIAATPGIMAEAASFALATQLPRAEAQALVQAALAAPDGFAATLSGGAPGVEWERVLDPASVVPACAETSARVFALRKASGG